MIGEGETIPSSPLVPKELAQPWYSRRCCVAVIGAVITFSITCSVILVTVFTWFGVFRGGFKWDPNTTLFNLHPTMMTLGLIAVPSLGVLSYRLFPFNKWTQKLIHATVMLITLLLGVLAIIVIEQEKFTTGATHFWSVHSWCGLSTILVICTQYLCGVVYLCPGNLLRKLRKFAVSWHRCFGLVIIWMATVTILAGVSEILSFGVADNTSNYGLEYSSYAPEGILGNIFAIFVILNSILLTLVLIGPMYQYLPRIEN